MGTTGTIVGNGTYTYEVNEDWARPPDGCEMMAASVTVDAQDRVYCFNRSNEHPVVVFDRDGTYLSSWGVGGLRFPTPSVRRDDNLWIVDRDHGQMMLLYYFGRAARTVGTKGTRSDTGVEPSEPDRTRLPARRRTAAVPSTCRRTST